MIALEDLEPLVEDMPVVENPEILCTLYKVFKSDFIESNLLVDGRSIKVILKKSNIPGFREYPETFVHIITRKSQITGKRHFEPERANRIHWVKNVLLQVKSPKIKFFKCRDEGGTLKDHYWYEEFDFMVVLKPLSSDSLIITAFCVDSLEKDYYRKKLKDYKNSIK